MANPVNSRGGGSRPERPHRQLSTLGDGRQPGKASWRGGGVQIVPVGVSWVEEGRKCVSAEREPQVQKFRGVRPCGLVGLTEFVV